MTLNNVIKNKLKLITEIQEELEGLASKMENSIEDIEDIWENLRLSELFNNENNEFLKLSVELGSATEENGYEEVENADLGIDYHLYEDDVISAEDEFVLFIDGNKLQKVLESLEGRKDLRIRVQFNNSYFTS